MGEKKKSDETMLWQFLPTALRDTFEIVDVVRSDNSIDVYLDEKTEALPIRTIARMYGVNGKRYGELYKNKFSGYRSWNALKVTKSGGVGYICFPENCGKNLGMDETSLSKGKVVTFLTNKDSDGMRGSLVAVIFSIKSHEITEALTEGIPEDKRMRVKEITTDLSSAMMTAAHDAFQYATLTNDRFHIQMLVNEATDDLRREAKREARQIENTERELCKQYHATYRPSREKNGETLLQCLSQARYAFVTPECKWTDAQRERVQILFDNFPKLQRGYEIISGFREIFNLKITPEQARHKIRKWCRYALDQAPKSFKTTVHTIKNNIFTISNYFQNRATNAFAESFNAKVKLFRTQLRGITDPLFFIFRLTKLFA